VLTDFEPGRIVLPYSQIWPTDILMPGAPIRITYVAGYPDLATLQSGFEGFGAVIQAMKLLIGFYNENRLLPLEFRHSAIPAGVKYVVEQVLQPYRIYEDVV
jgi:hypothetical protein